MAKVFIPQLPMRYDRATNASVPSIDVNPAAKYGELVMLFGSETPRATALKEVKRESAAVGPGDYILAVGDVVLLSLVIAYTLRRFGRATILRWDSDSRTYKTEGVEE